MRRTEAHQDVRMIKFVSILSRWEAAELNQIEAAELLGSHFADFGVTETGTEVAGLLHALRYRVDRNIRVLRDRAD
jgi:hypothetical protein